MFKIVHLIPYFGIGGVETAARSMTDVSDEAVRFCVQPIFSPPSGKSTRLFSPLGFLAAAFRLRRAAPDLLIVSLWRSCAVGVFVKLLRPATRLAVLLHFPADVHFIDRFFTRLAVRFSCGVWADSQETLARRLPGVRVRGSKVISFITTRVEVLPVAAVRPVFIFWGRMHPQKGLKRALNIFRAIHAQVPQAKFVLIGPDGGELTDLRATASSFARGDSVQFLGPRDFAAIRQVASGASFYLQTSELEGMAMSVVEAMQLGLVPVVSPVGEIARYARHGENAIVVRDDLAAVRDVLTVLGNDVHYQAMRQAALETWANRPLYKDSILDASRQILGIDTTRTT